MFCNQCEQTAKGEACTVSGVCGKNEDIQSLQESLVYSLKGVAAYAYHARELGYKDEQVDAFMHEALFKTLTNVDFSLNSHVGLVLKSGEMNLRAMEILDKANTETFGVPEPTAVKSGTVKGPGILVTGHDLGDLYELLKQTEGTGINIYTHGEMLPTLAYPKLKAFSHLKGNYGGAWQKQKTEFDEFGGPILATTNCVLIPKDSYRDRLYTTGITAIDDVKHLPDRKDYSEIIQHAKNIGDLPEREGKNLMTGFHQNVILELAPKIVEAVKAGKIKHFFVIGGCDGAKAGRNYFTELAKLVPDDCVILTVGCGKYRFNDLDFGDIDGIPRLLDMGQCNNAFSAIEVAKALAEVFECGVNDLPLSIALSWFEQKAVAILFSLLHLGVKNIRIGPTPPAFVTPNVFKVLQDNYNLMLVGDPAEDMKAMLAGN
ncbi:MAG: hydroxylamine reductase [Thermoplasmata archaeon]|nr:hydroxylamine reductase [Thermoplasmata archaeon]MCK5397259.1 hydroxylamine reductase [Thermoplasmata archaeon]